MWRLRQLKSLKSIVGTLIVGALALLTWIGYLTSVEWVVSVVRSAKTSAAAHWILSPLGRAVLLTLGDVAGFWLLYRAFKDRLGLSRRPVSVQALSVATIRSVFGDNTFKPAGTGLENSGFFGTQSKWLGICSIYNGGRTVGNVTAHISVIDEKARKLFTVANACWLDSASSSVRFQKGTTQHVALVAWQFNEPVVVPSILATTLQEKSIDVGNNYSIYVTIREHERALMDVPVKMHVASSITGQERTRVELELKKEP